MSRALVGNPRRVFADHRGRKGRLYREHFLALQKQYGPLTALLRDAASLAAYHYAAALESARDLDQAERLRANGRGRRPSVRLIQQLKKRAGIDSEAYDRKLDRLRELAADNGHDLGALFGRGKADA